MKDICTEIGEGYWFQFEAVGTDGDYVHNFVGSQPKFAPSQVMQIIKIFKDFRKPGKDFRAANFGVIMDIGIVLAPQTNTIHSIKRT